MDFIEKLLGVSPDNGSGMFELVLLAAPVIAAAAFRALSRRRRPA
jgi:hypothetical protein